MLKIKTRFLILSSLLVTLTGCMSLAEDITPPPGLDSPTNQPTVDPTTSEQDNNFIFPQELPDPNNGAILYTSNCASCHGDNGDGDGPDAASLENPIPSLASVSISRRASPMQWYAIITQGNLSTFMPAFSSLDEKERWDVVAYIYTLSASSETVLQGGSLFLEHCAKCHNEETDEGIPDLTNPAFLYQRSADDLIDTVLQGHEPMPAFNALSSDQIWSLSTYLRLGSQIPFEGKFANETSLQKSESTEESLTASGEINEDVPLSDKAEKHPALTDVNVNILNHSDDPLPPNLVIVLRGYDEMSEVYSQTLTLQSGNIIQFREVPRILERMYFATIEHENATYGSNVISVEEENQLFSLEIPYYPPTTDPTVLDVDRVHIFLDFADQQTLEIVQLYIFSNPSNMVLVPAEPNRTVVDFHIPSNASNLYVEEDMRLAYRKTNLGFGINNVYPDVDPYQAVFSYQIPYPQKELDLSIPIAMDANAMIVLAPADGFKVRSQDLEAAGTRQFQGFTYNMFTGSGIGSGDSLQLHLSGIPKHKTFLFSTGIESSRNLVIGLGGFGFALIVAGIFLIRRNKGQDFDIPDPTEEENIDLESADDLMDAIIALDDQYRSGSLPEIAYLQRRAELKERLRIVVGLK